MIKLNPENLVDRIIALWQTEDILRANHFNVSAIKQKQPSLSATEQEWLQKKADEMRDQGILESGHLQESKNWLSAFEDATAEIPSEVAKEFETLITTLGQHPGAAEHSSPVQTSFEILYGYYLKRIEGKELSQSVEVLARAIGEYLDALLKQIDIDNFAQS